MSSLGASNGAGSARLRSRKVSKESCIREIRLRLLCSLLSLKATWGRLMGPPYDQAVVTGWQQVELEYIECHLVLDLQVTELLLLPCQRTPCWRTLSLSPSL